MWVTFGTFSFSSPRKKEREKKKERKKERKEERKRKKEKERKEERKRKKEKERQILFSTPRKKIYIQQSDRGESP